MSTEGVARRPDGKAADAFRTISEVAAELDLPQHVLRFWETRFAQIKPMKRGGGRRYYRPEDVALLGGIRTLLYADGMTIRGVQRLLKEKGVGYVSGVAAPGGAPAVTRAGSAASVRAATDEADPGLSAGETAASQADPFSFSRADPDPAELVAIPPADAAVPPPQANRAPPPQPAEPPSVPLASPVVRAPDARWPASVPRRSGPGPAVSVPRAMSPETGPDAQRPDGDATGGTALPPETQRRLRIALADLEEAKRLLDGAL